MAAEPGARDISVLKAVPPESFVVAWTLQGPFKNSQLERLPYELLKKVCQYHREAVFGEWNALPTRDERAKSLWDSMKALRGSCSRLAQGCAIIFAQIVRRHFDPSSFTKLTYEVTVTSLQKFEAITSRAVLAQLINEIEYVGFDYQRDISTRGGFANALDSELYLQATRTTSTPNLLTTNRDVLAWAEIPHDHPDKRRALLAHYNYTRGCFYQFEKLCGKEDVRILEKVLERMPSVSKITLSRLRGLSKARFSRRDLNASLEEINSWRRFPAESYWPSFWTGFGNLVDVAWDLPSLKLVQMNISMKEWLELEDEDKERIRTLVEEVRSVLGEAKVKIGEDKAREERLMQVGVPDNFKPS